MKSPDYNVHCMLMTQTLYAPIPPLSDLYFSLDQGGIRTFTKDTKCVCPPPPQHTAPLPFKVPVHQKLLSSIVRFTHWDLVC